jgi:hypothetical protein
MKLNFTGHALRKMAERRIQPDWVAKTIDEAEYLRPDPYQIGAIRAFRRIAENEHRWLRAVYLDRIGERIVITVTWDRNAGKRR